MPTKLKRPRDNRIYQNTSWDKASNNYRLQKLNAQITKQHKNQKAAFMQCMLTRTGASFDGILERINITTLMKHNTVQKKK